MTTYTVCIIGFGSRGLTVFERLVASANHGPLAHAQIEIHIVDPGSPGAGIHTADQPDFVTLNTICAQLTMFVDEFAAAAGPVNVGPNFHEWLTASGYRLLGDGSVTRNIRKGRKIQPNDILPRRLLGEYLEWAFHHLVHNMPSNLSVEVHSCAAIHYESLAAGQHLITLDNGLRLAADFVFLTTGHSPNNGNGGFGVNQSGADERSIKNPYPLTNLDRIEPQASVALLGFGLTAMDAISQLTLGRGGSYICHRDSGHYAYVPSGKEPRILLASRTGLPYRSRPWIKSADVYRRYTPLYFTREEIDALRKHKLAAEGVTQLDFRLEVLPLLLCEMRCAYYLKHVEVEKGAAAAATLRDLLRQAQDEGRRHELLAKLSAQYGTFELEQEILNGIDKQWYDATQYHSWIVGFMDTDLREARAGKHVSPTKYSLDLLRDLRDVVRYTVNFGGVTSQSHLEFTQTYTGRFNQLVIGPSIQQSARLIALFEAGIVTAPFGPAPEITYDSQRRRFCIRSTRLASLYTEEVEWVCAGHIASPSVEQSASPLIQSLCKAGYIQPYCNGSASIGGIHIDELCRPVNRSGRSLDRFWVLGPLAEGIKYYNHYVAGPCSGAASQLEAGTCVLQLAEAVAEATC